MILIVSTYVSEQSEYVLLLKSKQRLCDPQDLREESFSHKIHVTSSNSNWEYWD